MVLAGYHIGRSCRRHSAYESQIAHDRAGWDSNACLVLVTSQSSIQDTNCHCAVLSGRFAMARIMPFEFLCIVVIGIVI